LERNDEFQRSFPHASQQRFRSSESKRIEVAVAKYSLFMSQTGGAEHLVKSDLLSARKRTFSARPL